MRRWHQILIAFFFVFLIVVISGLLLNGPTHTENVQTLQQNTPSKPSITPSNRNAESDPSNVTEPRSDSQVAKMNWYQNQVVVLMYHHVSPTGDKEYTLTPELFSEHMKFLHDNDLHPISLTEFLQFVNTGVLSTNNAVLITFDDGYESFYKEAYPILKEFNFPSVNFVIASRLRDSVERKRPNMIPPLTTEEVQEMIGSGLVEVGSHTYSLHDHIEKNDWGELEPGTAPVYMEDIKHVEDDDTYRNRLYVDFTMSRVALSDLVHKPIVSLSLPHGFTNQEVLDTAKDAGYHYVFNSRRGVVKPGVKPYDIPRFGVGSDYVDVDKLRQIFVENNSGH
ncbi:polysaccharide deacetylase family protein [Brevibacillus ginsengisoli]|uniref:polysaccharide deacetylase family protein n=1 Tax=Brevibacillus ginsengisoli TaxID=363854 RepID=UPI003CE95514